MKYDIYADNSATTKLDSDVLEEMLPFLTEQYGNPSQSYVLARIPKQALKKAREIIAECVNAEPKEIVFTSCGTESDNCAVKSSLFLPKTKNKILVSPIEHHAVSYAVKSVTKLGVCNELLSVNEAGRVNANDLKNKLSDNVGLVSVMLVNNEIGTIEPIEELTAIAHAKGALFHTDAVQAVGHIPVDVKQLGVDLLSASAHKFNGPKGIGFLYIKDGTPMESLLHGGGQEFGIRAGTENVASIVGMAAALKKNCHNLDDYGMRMTELEGAFIDELRKANIKFALNGDREHHLPGLISIALLGQSGEALLHRLDLLGISISTGSACNSKETVVSDTLTAIRLSPELAKGTIRISFGKYNTVNDAKVIADELIKIVG